MPKKTIQLSVPANLSYSSFVRHVADETFHFAQFEKAWASRLKLVMDELFMNAVKYGSTEDTSTVHITFEYDEVGISFRMEDDGTGPQAISAEELKTKVQQNEANTDLAKTSGRGLAMITKLWTDEMTIEKSEYGGIAVTVIKKLENTKEAPPPPPPPPVGLIQQMVQQAASETAPSTTPTPPKPVVSSAPAQGPAYEIKISGEIDMSNMAEKIGSVTDQIETMPDGSTLTLDFSELIYINSTFIGHLAEWHTHLQRKKGRLCLKNINNDIKEILELVGLLNVLQCTV